MKKKPPRRAVQFGDAIKALLDVESSFSKLQSGDAFQTLTSKQKAEYRAILGRFHYLIAEVARDTAEQQTS
jgi:hypothetical protein